jgi:hypothetical protein
MSTSVAALRRLLLTRSSFLAQSGNSSAVLALRSLSTRILTQSPRQLTPARATLALDPVRAYATTTTKKKPAAKKKTAAKKKPAAKKKKPAPKKKKAVKKKPVAKKKPKKKVVKSAPRPKITKLPSAHAIHGYSVYVMEHVKSVPGTTATERMQRAAAQWRALSDADKSVIPPSNSPHLGLFAGSDPFRRTRTERQPSTQIAKPNTIEPSQE